MRLTPREFAVVVFDLYGKVCMKYAISSVFDCYVIGWTLVIEEDLLIGSDCAFNCVSAVI